MEHGFVAMMVIKFDFEAQVVHSRKTCLSGPLAVSVSEVVMKEMQRICPLLLILLMLIRTEWQSVGEGLHRSHSLLLLIMVASGLPTLTSITYTDYNHWYCY